MGNVELNFDFMGSAELDWTVDVKESTASLVKQCNWTVLDCWVSVPVVIRGFISNCIGFALCSSLWCLFHLPAGRCPQLKRWNCQSGWCFHVPVAHVSYLVSSGGAFSSSSQAQGSSWSWALLPLTLRVPRSHLLFSSLCMTGYHETSYQQ